MLTKQMDGNWQTLEDEFEYRKFTEKYPAQCIQKDVHTEVPIIFMEYAGNTSIPSIIPYRLLGQAKDFKEGDLLYAYQPNTFEMAKSIGEALGFELVPDESFTKNTTGKKWSVPNHSTSDLRFIKINNQYKNNEKTKFYSVDYGTWSECVNRHQEHVALIREWFTSELQTIEAVGQNFDKAMVMSELKQILGLVDSIDVKTKSPTKPVDVKVKINHLLKKL